MAAQHNFSSSLTPHQLAAVNHSKLCKPYANTNGISANISVTFWEPSWVRKQRNRIFQEAEGNLNTNASFLCSSAKCLVAWLWDDLRLSSPLASQWSEFPGENLSFIGGVSCQLILKKIFVICISGLLEGSSEYQNDSCCLDASSSTMV